MHGIDPKVAVITSALLLCSLSACATRPGACIGSADPRAASEDVKVLINLDKNGVAIQGHDPVAYFSDAKPVMGDPSIRSTRGGAIYQFATAQNKAVFDADPAKYEPQYGGYCAYAASINTISPIDPAFWEIVDGRLILQHNKKAWDAWHKDPANNLVKADTNWPGLVDRNGSPPRILINVNKDGLALEGYDPTAYIIDGAPRQGDPALSRMYQGAMYYFVDAEHKNAFEKDPARFVPQFGGFCGYAASINKVSPVNPEIWQVVDGRVVLQHTPKAYELFNQDVPGYYAKARMNWPGLSRRRCR